MSRLDLHSSGAGASPTARSSHVCLAALLRSHSLVPLAPVACSFCSVSRTAATAADAVCFDCLLRRAWLSKIWQNTPAGTTPFRIAFPLTCCPGRLATLVHSTSSCRLVPSISHGQSKWHWRSSKSCASPSAFHSAPNVRYIVCFFGHGPPSTSSALEQCEPTVSCQPGFPSTRHTPGKRGNALLCGFSITTSAPGMACCTFSMRRSMCSNM